MTTKHIKTSKSTDSLGTRYDVDVFTDNGVSSSHNAEGTFTNEDDARETAFSIYAGLVDSYGMDNVYVSMDY